MVATVTANEGSGHKTLIAAIVLIIGGLATAALVAVVPTIRSYDRAIENNKLRIDEHDARIAKLEASQEATTEKLTSMDRKLDQIWWAIEKMKPEAVKNP